MKKKSAKFITDCAAASAISALILIVSAYVPFISFIATFVCGSGAAYVIMKDGIGAGVCTVWGTMFLASVLIGNFLTVLMLTLIYVIPGFAAGVSYKICGDKGFYKTLAVTGTVYLLSFMVMFFFMTGGGQIQEFFNLLSQSVTETVKGILSGISGHGISEDAVVRAVEEAVNIFRKYLPAIFVCIAAVFAYITIMFNNFLMRRLKVADMKYPAFSEIAAPRFMCLILIVLYVIILATDSKSAVNAICQNLSAVTSLTFAVCGMSAFDGFLNSKIPSGYKRCVIYLIVFVLGFSFMSFIIEILAMFGFFDAINGFRKFFIDMGGYGNVRYKTRRNLTKEEFKEEIKNIIESCNIDNQRKSDKNNDVKNNNNNDDFPKEAEDDNSDDDLS